MADDITSLLQAYQNRSIDEFGWLKSENNPAEKCNKLDKAFLIQLVMKERRIKTRSNQIVTGHPCKSRKGREMKYRLENTHIRKFNNENKSTVFHHSFYCRNSLSYNKLSTEKLSLVLFVVQIIKLMSFGFFFYFCFKPQFK